MFLFKQKTAYELRISDWSSDVCSSDLRVAWRHDVPVKIVSNSRLRVPDHPLVERVLVSDGFDAADDWIADAATPCSIVVTADILLADRALKAGATVLAPTGKPFTAASIGPAIATRAIMADLRSGMSDGIGGPPPFSKARSEEHTSELQSLMRN